MTKNLVIVESPAKARTINKILGKDFVVKASLGHVRDLPEKKLGVDIEHGFKPQYELMASRKKTISELQQIAKGSEKIYLAPDPDREGEAIAWHLKEALTRKGNEDAFYRVTYNEITAPAIRKAFEHPTRIDQHRVDAQQARRVLDRIVGYQVSPLLWRRIRGASSAGRVQSVALRLVCEREDEIRAFVPEEYWLVGARVNKRVPPIDPFLIRLAKINGKDPEIKTGEQAASIRADLDTREIEVSAINDREINKRARPPYITSTLQQAGSSALGFTPKRTMSIAQKLYEGVNFGDGSVGLITYMRTDSPSISPVAQEECRAYVLETYGAEYVPEKPNFFKGRDSAQAAHEAIRPTDVKRTPESVASYLKPEELRLYRLIWERFVASQMTPARIAQRTVEMIAPAKPGATVLLPEMEYLFRATASVVVFPGYMKVTGEEKKKKAKEESDGEDGDLDTLPTLETGERLDCQEWLTDQKFTKPPPRFTEASLVKTLEENGVGRPSTYAQIIQTLYTRKYMEKEKTALKPTPTGEQVVQFLVAHLGKLFDVQFTAGMEKELDEVEEGTVVWTDMMEKFYKNFLGWMDGAKEPEADQTAVPGLLDFLAGIKEWEAPVTRGKRTYSDEAFVESVREQITKGKKVSQRQVEALVKVGWKYQKQLPGLKEKAIELGLDKEFATASIPKEPPREETVEKLTVLSTVKFDEPRTVGKKVYDDQVFCDSLRGQVESGKRLSLNQIVYLDRLVQKYADQIEGFEAKGEQWGIRKEEQVPPEAIRPLLDQLAQVKEWKPAVKRGKREWDDRKFFESLQNQFKQKNSLSAKQVASLQKMAGRYAAAAAKAAATPKADEAAPKK